MIYWLLLLVTIIFEIAGTVAMKLSNGLTKLVPSVLHPLYCTWSSRTESVSIIKKAVF